MPDLLSLGTLWLSIYQVDTFEDLLDVLVDWSWVFSLPNDFEEILIGQEVETWEQTSLGGKQILKLLLHYLELVEHVVESCNEISDKLNKGCVCLSDVPDSRHFFLEDYVNLSEDSLFLRKLLGKIWLPTENAPEVHPVLLHLHQQVECLGDPVDVVLPQVDLIIELLVIWRTLHGCEILRVIFNVCDDVLGVSHFIVHVIVIYSAFFRFSDHVELSLLRVFPHCLDLVQFLFDLQLLLSVHGQVTNLLLVVDELEIEALLKRETWVVFIKVLLDFNSELLPMTVTHGFVSQVSDEWKCVSENAKSITNVLSDFPLALFFLEGLDFGDHLKSSIVHFFNVELLEDDVLPAGPIVVPLLLVSPDLCKRGVFLFNFVEVGISCWLNLEDLKTEEHLFFSITESFALIGVMIDLLCGDLVLLLCFLTLGDGPWCVLSEVFEVFTNFTFELINCVFHDALELSVALHDDCVCISHAEQELLVLCIDGEEVVLVFLSQLNSSNFTVQVVIHNEFELLLNWLDSRLVLWVLCLHLLVLLTVMLELCTVLAWSLEFLYVVVEFIKE